MSFINILNKKIKSITSIVSNNDTIDIIDSDNNKDSLIINNVQTALSLTTLKRNYSYSIGDIAYSSLLPNWARLECVKSGTTSINNVEFGNIAGILVVDGTCTWIIDDVREYGRPGDIFIRPILHSGYLKADGSIVKASSYPRLLSFVNDNNLIATSTEYVNNCGKYVYDSTNDTLQVPNMTGRVLQGGDTVASKEAGLPNIVGRLSLRPNVFGNVAENKKGNNSALYLDSNSETKHTGYVNSGTSDYYDKIYIDASQANTIYGNSTTVQPPALQMIAQIKY